MARTCWLSIFRVSGQLIRIDYNKIETRYFGFVGISYQAPPVTALPNTKSSRLAGQLLFAYINNIKGWRSANSQLI